MESETNIIPLNNYILYLPSWDINASINIGGKLIPIDTTYLPGEHQPVLGTVLAVPPSLTYDEHDTLDWDTEMELQVGDEIICNYFEIYQAIEGQTQRKVKVGDKEALLIRYDRVYAAKREGRIIPVNGYLFLSAIDPLDMDKLDSSLTRKFDHDTRFGKMEYTGSRVKSYRYDKYSIDDFDPEVGEMYAFDDSCDLLVEHSEHLNFFDKKMFRMQRRNIIGKLIR